MFPAHLVCSQTLIFGFFTLLPGWGYGDSFSGDVQGKMYIVSPAKYLPTYFAQKNNPQPDITHRKECHNRGITQMIRPLPGLKNNYCLDYNTRYGIYRL
jgi:hypothetical protein